MIGILAFTLTSVVLLVAARTFGVHGRPADLGWMSERWLAENRASHQ